jgi:uracil-DNA glycosylase
MLWGNFARKKEALIASDDNLILKAMHPSPFAAYKGFFGCRHFSQANQYLVDRGLEPIGW